jgi:hypothetical protein
MAFVNGPAPVLGLTSFAGATVCPGARPGLAVVPVSHSTPCMLIENGMVTSTSGSKWKENVFTGGIPGGEEFYQKWIEEGANGNFDDMPDYLQPSAKRVELPEKAPNLVERLNRMEFFKGFPTRSDSSTPPPAPVQKVEPVKAVEPPGKYGEPMSFANPASKPSAPADVREPTSRLVQGSGGGVRLEFSVDGEIVN